MTATLNEVRELSDELEVDVTEFLADDGSVADIDALINYLHCALKDLRDYEMSLLDERIDDLATRIGNVEDELVAMAEAKSSNSNPA